MTTCLTVGSQVGTRNRDRDVEDEVGDNGQLEEGLRDNEGMCVDSSTLTGTLYDGEGEG